MAKVVFVIFTKNYKTISFYLYEGHLKTFLSFLHHLPLLSFKRIVCTNEICFSIAQLNTTAVDQSALHQYKRQ